MDVSLLWIPATLAAAVAQTARNATQRRLTETLGTVGATQVRFLYGLPFAALFLVLVLALSGERLPMPGPGFYGFILMGATTQILATALMLAAMRERSFSVVTATTKTEPVHIAVFGLVVLGDPVTPLAAVAILVATSGVILMSFRSGLSELGRAGLRPILLGVVAGAFFGLAATGFRGAILSLASGGFFVRATTTLVCGLILQTAILVAWLLAFNRPALIGSLREWRSSLFASFLGALASQFWFIGFALTAAANVRTLALVEVPMAQAVSHRLLAEGTTRRELLGIALIVAGVALLLWAAAWGCALTKGRLAPSRLAGAAGARHIGVTASRGSRHDCLHRRLGPYDLRQARQPDRGGPDRPGCRRGAGARRHRGPRRRRDRARAFQRRLLAAGLHRLAGSAGKRELPLQARDQGRERLRDRLGRGPPGDQDDRGEARPHHARRRRRADDPHARPEIGKNLLKASYLPEDGETPGGFAGVFGKIAGA